MLHIIRDAYGEGGGLRNDSAKKAHIFTKFIFPYLALRLTLKTTGEGTDKIK